MRSPYLDDGDVRPYLGDCVEVMREMDAESVDAVVCDPPYGLEFMGKEWDSFATYAGGNPNMKPQGATVGEASGVTYGYRSKNPRCTRCGKLKRGNGACKCPEPRWDTRTSESAFAFQSWSAEWATAALRVLKPGGHLLAFGGTRTFHRLTCGIEDAGFEIRDCLSWLYGSGFPKSLDVSKAIDKAAGAARTAGAREWEGWGTALKPAWEPCVVARKPLAGTVAENVQQHGTGAVNVDGCRVGTDGATKRGDTSTNHATATGWKTGHDVVTLNSGRWPANVALDEDAAAMLDAQSGERKSPAPYTRSTEVSGIIYAPQIGAKPAGSEQPGYGDTGGASRFYYTAKASRADRNTSGANNTHPTVKPTDLMRWLVRMVTPPGGVVLDPFAGSGSTLVAARAEGVRAIGIEQAEEYAAIISQRLSQLSLLF